jgi:hypothetical protein
VTKDNLLFLLTICNIFSMAVCIKIIVNFVSEITRGREERQKRRHKLYYNSVIFVLLVGVVSFVMLFTPFRPELFLLGNSALDICIALLLLFWWAMWQQSVYLHISTKFMQLLKTEDPKSRNTFMARISNLASKHAISNFCFRNHLACLL